MKFQREKLWQALVERGWEIEVLDNYDFQRWSKETWLVSSTWTPVGATAYMSFKLDEMEMRPESEFVWAIAVYSEPPLYGVRDKCTMSLIHWESQMPKFLQTLETLRANHD